MRTKWSLLALTAALAVQTPALAAETAPPASRTAPSLPAVTPEEAVLDAAAARAGVRADVSSTGDADEDAALSARADADHNGILAIRTHEADLRKVIDHMPAPFIRLSVRGGRTVYRGDSMEDCLAFAARQGKGASKDFVCAGNPYPTAAFYLGSYYNELGRPDDGLAVLDKGLIAAPDSPLLITERNAALIALGRVDEVLQASDRGLRIANLSTPDHARLLRNRGYALTELRRLDEAEQAYRDALALQPDNALAKNELTYIASLKAGGERAPGGMNSVAPPKN
jgi:tetratricopeptide (TPR) repeat protein